MHTTAKLAICLGISASFIAFAQTSSSVAKTAATTPAAYVYVQSSTGVQAYSAASSGQLTKISGSPFNTTGLISGTTGSIFYAVGTDYVHSYTVESNGAIGAQTSQIDGQNYSGAACGTNQAGGSGILDHTGKYFYLILNNFNENCIAYQTYSIGTNGMLTFNNWTETNYGISNTSSLPTILGNEAFAYAVDTSGHNSNFVGFAREASGALQTINFRETDPSSSNGTTYDPVLVAADPTNHLAAALAADDTVPPVLASYTVDSAGNIVSTNTTANTPTVPFDATLLAMSPSGTLLAVASCCTSGQSKTGLILYHFNGASPITAYSGIVNSADIEEMKWDNANHLYVMSTKLNKLYVYTVTATSITQAPGSPYSITDPTALVVRAN